MHRTRIRAGHYNKRCRRLMATFELALRHKERRETLREQFEAEHAPAYQRYGHDVEAADRARQIYLVDEVADLSDAEIAYIKGRIVLEKKQ